MRILYLLSSLVMLASCSGISASSAAQSSADLPPGFSGASGPSSVAGAYMPAPEFVARFLLSLRDRDVLVSQATRRRYLQRPVLVQEIPVQGASPDYLVVDRNGPGYGFWVRSFPGSRPELTGYLVSFQGLCAELEGITPAPAAVERQCTHDKYFDSGIRAYQVVEGQMPRDVTESIGPDPAVARLQRERYEAMGGSEIFADDQNLDRVRVLRWVVDFDPEHPVESSDPPIFLGGHHAHAGFVVWTGERFERRTTVPRALWPCRVGRPSECPPQPGYEDPFVID